MASFIKVKPGDASRSVRSASDKSQSELSNLFLAKMKQVALRGTFFEHRPRPPAACCVFVYPPNYQLSYFLLMCGRYAERKQNESP